MSERRKWPLLLACLAVVYGLFTVPPLRADDSVKVAAAADLQPMLPALLATWKAQTGESAAVSFASSATLATQIENGAPYDLFLSADMSFPEKLARDGWANGKPVPYAQGALVLWALRSSSLPPLSMTLLGSPAIQSIAIANAAHAPYGRAAMAALTSLHLLDATRPKLRFAENIAQAAQFVQSGNAQVGLLSLTSALSPPLAAQGHYIEVPLSSYPPIVQGAVLLKHGSHPDAARALLTFLLSPAVRQQLPSRGLRSPQ